MSSRFSRFFSAALAITSVLLLSSNAHAVLRSRQTRNIDFTQVRGAALNPIDGLPWKIGKTTENYYDLLGPDDDFGAIARILFYRGGEFAPSKKWPGAALSPYVIGRWLAALTVHADGVVRDDGQTPIAALVDLLAHPQPHINNRKRKALNQNAWAAPNQQKLAELVVRRADDSRTYRLFIALLWEKATSREHILDYYRGLLDEFGGRWSTYLRPELQAVIADPAAWLALEYDEAFVLPPAGAMEPYDDFLHSFFDVPDPAPPLETTGTSTPSQTGLGFSDCAETAWRDALMMISDRAGELPVGHDYDTEILRRLGADDRIVVFFGEAPPRGYPTRALQRTPEARNAWIDIASNLPEPVQYALVDGAFRYNMRGGGDNMLAAFKAMFPRAMPPVQTWNDFVMRVNAASHGLRDGVVKLEAPPSSEKAVSAFSVGRWHFEWHFGSGHSHIALLSKLQQQPIPLDLVFAVAASPDNFQRSNTIRARTIDLAPFRAVTKKSVTAAPAALAPYILLQNEDATVDYLTHLPDDASLVLRVGLMNRLTQHDAQKRVFANLVTRAPWLNHAVNTNEALIPTKAQALAAIEAKRWDQARRVARRSGLVHDAVSGYFFGVTTSQKNAATLQMSFDRKRALVSSPAGDGHPDQAIVFEMDGLPERTEWTAAGLGKMSFCGSELLVAQSVRELKLIDVTTGAFVRDLIPSGDAIIVQIECTDDGRYALARILEGGETRAVLLDVASGRRLQSFPAYRGAKVGPGGRLIATIDRDVWFTFAGDGAQTSDGLRFGALASSAWSHYSGNTLAFSEMGDRLFVGGVSLKGAVFDTKTGAAYRPDDHLRMAPDWRSNVLLRFTALGAGRYAIALRDGMRALVDVETGVTRVLLGPEALVGEGAAISDDGRRLVTRGLRGNGAKIWDVEAGRILYELPDTGRFEAVFDDTGRRLVTVSEDQITRVWEVDRLPPPAVPAMLAPMQ